MLSYWDPVTPIRNRKNFSKYALFYFEPCTSAMLQVYRWLYSRKGYPEDVVDYCEAFSNVFCDNEILKLEEIQKDNQKLKDLTINELFKLIQHGTSSNKISPPYNDVWTQNCPTDRLGDLEHLLFLVQEGKNMVSGVRDHLKYLTDNDAAHECSVLSRTLTSIIQKAGARSDVSRTEIEEVITSLTQDLERIRDAKEGKEVTDKGTLLRFIREDLQLLYKRDLDHSFQNNLKSYSLGNMIYQDNSIFSARRLLSVANCQIVVIQGEAGIGKTSLTKFLFHCWLSGDFSKVTGLSFYDVVFRIPCRVASAGTATQFLKEEIPIAYGYLANASTLMEYMKDFRTLWIIDSYEESTPEVKGLLCSIVKNLSHKHKIIITTRFDYYKEITDDIQRSFDLVTISGFSTEEIEKFTMSHIGNHHEASKFLSSFRDFDFSTQQMLKVPINLKLFLDLWNEGSFMTEEKLSTAVLFDKTFKKQLHNLVQVLECKIFTSHELSIEERLDKWFHGSLCKTAAVSLLNHYRLCTDDQTDLREDARNLGLIESYCLSTFLDVEHSFLYGFQFCYLHRTQMEALAALYFMRCNQKEIRDHLLKERHVCSSSFRVKDISSFPSTYLALIPTDSTSMDKLFLIMQNIRHYKTHKLMHWFDTIKNEDFNPIVCQSVQDYLTSNGYQNDLFLNANEITIFDKYIEHLRPGVKHLKIEYRLDKKNLDFQELLQIVSKHQTPIGSMTFDFSFYAVTTQFKKLNQDLELLAASNVIFKNVKVCYESWSRDCNSSLHMSEHFQNLQRLNKVTEIVICYLPPFLLHIVPLEKLSGMVHIHFDFKMNSMNSEDDLNHLLNISKRSKDISFDIRYTRLHGFIRPISDMRQTILGLNIRNLKLNCSEEAFLKTMDGPTTSLFFCFINCKFLETLEIYFHAFRSRSIAAQLLDRWWNVKNQTKLKDVTLEFSGQRGFDIFYDQIPDEILHKTKICIHHSDEICLSQIPSWRGRKFKNLVLGLQNLSKRKLLSKAFSNFAEKISFFEQREG